MRWRRFLGRWGTIWRRRRTGWVSEKKKGVMLSDLNRCPPSGKLVPVAQGLPPWRLDVSHRENLEPYVAPTLFFVSGKVGKIYESLLNWVALLTCRVCPCAMPQNQTIGLSGAPELRNGREARLGRGGWGGRRGRFGVVLVLALGPSLVLVLVLVHCLPDQSASR